ncbi:hypothetical protein J4E05_20055 [Thalassospira sp. NFXS8]|uniref:hypothetical protein n=1 Tax=Thalassospira sp. NFXS8 TaxID=2819093 RepID=UPI0032DF00FB
MKLLRSVGVAFLVSTAFVGAYGTTAAFAQSAGQSAGIAQLPPALRAALLAGNSNAIQQAIQTLSGGNATRAASLAQQVAAAAEGLVQTNPQAALAAAQAAVNVVSNNPVQTSAPAAANNVAAIAARIVVHPNVIQVAPAQVAQVATQAVQVATSPVVYQSNPTASIQVAANSYAAVTNSKVVSASPDAAQRVTLVIRQASANSELNGANQANSAQMSAILPQDQQPVAPSQDFNPYDGSSTEPPVQDSELVNNASPT